MIKHKKDMYKKICLSVFVGLFLVSVATVAVETTKMALAVDPESNSNEVTIVDNWRVKAFCTPGFFVMHQLIWGRLDGTMTHSLSIVP